MTAGSPLSFHVSGNAHIWRKKTFKKEGNPLMKASIRKVLALLVSVLLVVFTAAPALSADTQDTEPIGAQVGDGGHWAQDELDAFLNRHWLLGDGDGNYREDDPVTRAEFMALVNRVYDYSGTAPAAIARFEDVEPDAWYYGDVSAALAEGYIKGTGPTPCPRRTTSRWKRP